MGEDIDRNFIKQTACWDIVRRVALTRQQIEAYDLPPMPGKSTDTRAKGFIARHGALMQVEVDALPPDVLRALFEAAVAPFVDASQVAAVIARETRERTALTP
ncbi:MAG: hypothetical protein GEV06_09405 [Luteitalea sp.]|nr:hypothetical protein [Luteitalea sp.]